MAINLKIVLTLTLIFLLSCENNVDKEFRDTKNIEHQNHKKKETDSLKQFIDVDRQTQINLSRIIVNYYKDTYSTGFQVDEQIDKGSITLTFYKNESKNNSENWWSWSMHIPQNIILGDLNKDGAKDAIVDVIKGGCGVGANFEENELFYFENTKGNYNLKKVVMSNKLSNCVNGSFTPERIENNVLIGSSNCYKESDPTCCPSITFSTKLVYANNEFKILKEK